MEPSPLCGWVWRSILKLRSTLLPHVQLVLGHDSAAKFWFEPWVGRGMILYDLLTYDQRNQTGIPLNARASDYIYNGVITLPYSSNPIVMQLWGEVQCKKYLNGHEGYVWAAMHGQHTINRVYKALLIGGRCPIFRWHARVWNPITSQKLNFLLWKVLRNALMTKDKLGIRGYSVDLICVLCNNYIEDGSHLFFDCLFTKGIWKASLLSGGFTETISNGDAEWNRLFRNTRWKNATTYRLLLILKVFVQVIWEERNSRVFENKMKFESALINIIISRVKEKSSQHSAYDFIS